MSFTANAKLCSALLFLGFFRRALSSHMRWFADLRGVSARARAIFPECFSLFDAHLLFAGAARKDVPNLSVPSGLTFCKLPVH
jgi:hypothetical protein